MNVLIFLISPATFSPGYSFICSVCPSIIFFKLCKSKMTNIYTHIIRLVLRHLMVVNKSGIEPE